MLAVLPSLEWVHTAVVFPASPERYHGFVPGFLLKETWGRDGREERDLTNRSTGTQVDQNQKCPYLLRISWTQSALKGMAAGASIPWSWQCEDFPGAFMEAKGRMAVPPQSWWALKHFWAWCRPQNSTIRQLGSEEKPVMCMWFNGASSPQGWRADLLISIEYLYP